MSDPVRQPEHYRQHPAGVECVTIAAAFPFCLGSALKYIWRAGLKPDNDARRDLRKAIRFLEYEIQRLETGRVDPAALDDGGA